MSLVPPAAATPAKPPSSQFNRFCRSELEYHKQMVAMYEWMLAQDLIGISPEIEANFQAIFMAGMDALASQHKK
jgi:hypothetical protein